MVHGLSPAGGGGGGGYDGAINANEEETFIVLVKLAGYKLDVSAGIDMSNRAVDWSSYPSISLTQTENRFK